MSVLMFLLALCALAIHGQGNYNASGLVVQQRVVRNTDENPTCDEFEPRLYTDQVKAEPLSYAIPVHPREWFDSEDNVKKFTMTVVNVAQALVETIPDVPGLSNIIKPILDLLKGPDDALVKEMRQGFKEIRLQIAEHLGRIEFKLDFEQVRQIETNSKTLMKSLTELVDNYGDRGENYTINKFLQQCERNDPYTMIQDLSSEVARILNSHYENDVLRSRNGLLSLKRRLNSILNELTISFLFELYLRGEEDIEPRKVLLSKMMSEIEETMKEVLNKLLDSQLYWAKIEDLIAKASEGLGGEDLQETANFYLDVLQKVHTNDRFCVMVNDGTHFLYAARRENIAETKARGKGIVIIRSRSVHNMTLSAYNQMGRDVADMSPAEFNSPHGPDHHMYKLVDTRGFGFIDTRTPTWSRKSCECIMGYQFRQKIEYIMVIPGFLTPGQRIPTSREYHLIPK